MSLVAPDGGIVWLCHPAPDSGALLASLLGVFFLHDSVGFRVWLGGGLVMAPLSPPSGQA